MPASGKPDFRMIRAGSGYSIVLLVSPADACDGDERAKYYEFNPGRSKPNWKSDAFNEVCWARDARYLFSGHADGMGFAEIPEEPFPSLDAALAFVQGKRGI